jgi:PAS domain S-box-containing protein
MTDGPERMTTGRVRASDGGSPRELGDVSPDWYRGLIERLPLTVYVDRPDETSSNVYTSPQLEAVLGYSTREWAEDEELFLKVLHPEDRERVMALQRRTRETGEPFRTEYRMIARDGRVVWFLDDATVVRDEAGRPAFHQGFLVDITERKRLEEALRQSEDAVRREKQYVESLLEISPTAIVTLDLGGAVTSWNLAAEELFGYTRDEVIGHQLDDFIQKRDDLRAEGAAFYDEFVRRGRFHATTRRTRKDGTLVDVEIFAVPVSVDGQPTGHLAVYHDITAAKAQQVAETRYRDLVEQLPLVTYVDEPAVAPSIYVSPQVETLVGYSADEWLGDPDLFLRLLHPDDRERVLADRERVFAAGDSSWSFEYRLIARDGRTVAVRDDAVVIKDDEGTPLYVQGFLMDTTERKAAEEPLRKSDADLRRQTKYYESLLEISPVAVVTLDLAERVTSWNPAAERLFGYSEAEALGRTIQDLILRTDALSQEGASITREAIAEGSSHRISRRMRKNGTLVDVEVLVVSLRMDGEPIGSYAIYHDVSELHRQKQYFESLLEISPTAIITVDLEDKVTSWNPAAEKLFGNACDEAVGRNIDALVAASDELRANAAVTNIEDEYARVASALATAREERRRA